jgi:two-component system, response regulator YesN
MVQILIANRERYETNGMDWLLKSNDPSLMIRHAETFSELQKNIENLPVDILILEIELITSFEQEKLIKWIKIFKPKVIGLTIEATFEMAMKAIDLGVHKLLLKPLLPEQLQRNVQILVRELKSEETHKPARKKLINQIQLEQLFNDNEIVTDDNLVFLGFKTENQNELKKLYTYLKEYSFQSKCDFYSLSDVIIGISYRSNLPWIDECQRLLRDWQLNEMEPISISIFIPYGRNLTIHELYIETRKMLEVTFFIGYNQVLKYDEKLAWKKIDPFLNQKDQKMWIEFLNQSHLAGIKQWLYEEFLHFESPYPDPGLIRIRLTSVLAQIRRYIKGNTIFSELEEDYLNLFNQVLYSTVIYRNVQELILFTEKIFNIKESVGKRKKDLIDKCLDYIHTHYWQTSLSVESIGRTFNRNSSYISSLFKQKTGKTFRETLNEIRITKAKKLLQETEMSVKEISSICGFAHQQYFSRVFKQKTNQTPNQYRGQNF